MATVKARVLAVETRTVPAASAAHIEYLHSATAPFGVSLEVLNEYPCLPILFLDDT